MHGIYLLFINHHGSPSNSKDLHGWFMLYAFVFALDVTVLINFSFHCFYYQSNFNAFGWVFAFLLVGVPYLAPMFAIVSTILGSENLLRITGNLNSMTVCFNYSLTFFACLISKDDVMYSVMLVFMFFTKCVLSAVAAKIRVYLANPRYAWNEETLNTIMS